MRTFSNLRVSSEYHHHHHLISYLTLFTIQISSVFCYSVGNGRPNANPFTSGGTNGGYGSYTGPGRASGTDGVPTSFGGGATCSPNVYVAPTINCSTNELHVELKRIQQDVAMLYENMQRLVDRVGSALPGVLPRDCKDVQQRGSSASGTYTIQPDHNGWPFQVYCDMETDGGGWTVFQRRSNGSEQFRRGWASYRRGFGSTDHEFWLGLDRLHRITYQDEYELRVDMSDFDNIAVHAGYTWFRVDGVASNYRLHVGEYHGIAGDALSYQDGQEFSTKDRDHDASNTSHCAVDSGEGGWWFNQCLEANPNGLYLGGHTERSKEGVVWTTWKGSNYSLKTFELKLRPVAD